MFFLEGYCGDLYPIIKLIKLVIELIKFAVPITLILFITIDMVRAVISSNEENMKKAQNTAIKRLIYALGIFLVFSVVQVVMGIIAEAGVKDLAGENIDTVTWKACWTCKSKKDCKVVEPGGEGVCCVLPNDKGERYIWHESANSCPSGEWKTDMKKSICMGNSSPIKGACCYTEKNGEKNYIWKTDSNTCPSGTTKDASKLTRDKCVFTNGICCKGVDPITKTPTYEWYSSGKCPTGRTNTYKTKDNCYDGVCCSRTENDNITFFWNSGSNTCPSGSNIESNKEKSSCSGTLS